MRAVIGLDHRVIRKVARYHRERTPRERERLVQALTVRRSMASSFLPGLSCGLRRGHTTLPLMPLFPLNLRLHPFFRLT